MFFLKMQLRSKRIAEFAAVEWRLELTFHGSQEKQGQSPEASDSSSDFRQLLPGFKSMRKRLQDISQRDFGISDRKR